MRNSAWYTDAKTCAALIAHAVANRLDAGETGAFTRQLTYIIKRLYDKKYPDLRARDFIPFNREVPDGAETWAERGYDWFGMAKIGDGHADDLPVVTVQGEEVLHKPKLVFDAYEYTLDEIRRSQFGGLNLDTKYAFAARRAWENVVEQVAAKGDAPANLPGFLNNSNVPVVTGGVTSGFIGSWDTATSSQILSDLQYLESSVFTTSKTVWRPDTLLLPPSKFKIVMAKPFSDLVPEPVGKVFLRTSLYVKNIDQWNFLETADAGLTGPRAVCYLRDAEVVEFMMMREFTQNAPQPKALKISIPCDGKIGGVSWHYPLAAVYADSI